MSCRSAYRLLDFFGFLVKARYTRSSLSRRGSDHVVGGGELMARLRKHVTLQWSLLICSSVQFRPKPEEPFELIWLWFQNHVPS